jgi:hypothetical protein
MALEICLLSCFESHQIWLNMVMDDHHWSNITNISIYKIKKTLKCFCDDHP